MAANPTRQTQKGTAPSHQPQLPQITLLGTLPLCYLSPLLAHVSQNLTATSPLPLCEKETILSRQDDVFSQPRERNDNAWAAVVMSRKAVRLRVRQGVAADGKVECNLFLPLVPLPERQYPRVTVRPTVTVEVGVNHKPTFTPKTEVSQVDLLDFDPDTALDTDQQTGWRNLVSALGWVPDSTFLRYGLEYPLPSNDRSAQVSSLNARTRTKHSLLVYRIFRPSDQNQWQPLGPTVIVELVSLVGGQVDPNHLVHPSVLVSTPSLHNLDTVTGLDPDATIENAITHVESIAASLREFVNLKRENISF